MSKEKITFEEEVPLKEKVAYGSATSASLFLSGVGLGAIDVFYLKATTIDPSLMAISWLIFIIWNAINDPLIGIFQDKTSTKMGRRVPYLRFGAPLYVISFIILWFPFTTNAQLLFWNHLLMLFIFDTIFTTIGLITYALPAEMAITAKERGSIMIITTALGAIGLLGSIAVPLIFLGATPQILEFRIAMIIFGSLAGLAIFIASYFIEENEYAQLEPPLGFFESIKETFKNKAFLIAEVAIFSMVIMQQILQSYLVFLFDYLIFFKLNLFNIVSFLILAVFVGFFIMWINGNIKNYGLKTLMRVGALVGIAGFSALLILGILFNANQNNKMPFFIVVIPIAAILLGLLGFMVLSQPLMADCMDYDEVLTGKRRETTYSGMNALFTKPAVSIGKAAFLFILGFYGYQSAPGPGQKAPPPAEQLPSVADGVILAFTLIPIICLLIGFIALHWFPLDGKEWKKQKKRLQEIHQEKEREYIKKLKKEENI